MKKIVVLHGWGQNSASWHPFMNTFSEGEVECFDLPGFGSEPRPTDAWGVPEYAAWVRARIESSGWTDVVLLGHSFGGRIAAYLAADRPAWLSRLVLYGAPCVYRPLHSVRLRNALARFLRPIRRVVSSGLRTPDLRDAEAAGLGDVFRRVVGFDQTERLARIAVPTLLVWGSDDAEVSLAVAEETCARIPGSELKVIERAGHNAHLDAPYYFYGIVRTFAQDR